MTSDLKERTKLTTKRFSCGGRQFTVSLDPETGLWDHDQHAARTLAHFGSGETMSFEAVAALCRLLSEGAVEIGQGIKAAQCAAKFKAGVKANPSEFYPEFALIYLMLMADGKLEFEHAVRPGFYEDCQPDRTEVRSRRFGTFRTEYKLDNIPSQAAWLRVAMQAAERIPPGRDAVRLHPDIIVASFAINVDRGWDEDDGLWAEYAEWAAGGRNVSESLLSRTLFYRDGYSDIPAEMPKSPDDPYRVIFNVLRARRDGAEYQHAGAFLGTIALYAVS